MRSDLSSYESWQLKDIENSRKAQEFYDEQQRIYERNKLIKDLKHQREMEKIRRSHNSEVALQALDEIHILQDRIEQLKKVVEETMQ